MKYQDIFVNFSTLCRVIADGFANFYFVTDIIKKIETKEIVWNLIDRYYTAAHPFVQLLTIEDKMYYDMLCVTMTD